MNEQQPTDFLGDEFRTPEFEYATQGQRFVNYLVDQLFMNYVIGIATEEMIRQLIVLIDPGYYSGLATSNSMSIAQAILVGFLISIVNYVLYYTLCEKNFRGYTLGKLISGTRAVRQDGGELTFRDALLRSLVRLIPFEPLSGFSTLTWHDRWTDTMVIKSR